ncbi:sodium/hydrogen exchanger 6-like isoform X2 [Daphnia pulicaria]|uniref:sodium/hydrogen exchanger 6-like isoform X2 n=1 Tax=Daphnia pulicaria TaxID=35523 RepID=UPI001EEAFD0C|nr:sodium/hydrogen exchanger 6-like isoform X2 [Daphnia pulicaria]
MSKFSLFKCYFKGKPSILVLVFLSYFLHLGFCQDLMSGTPDSEYDEKALNTHRLDNLNLLLYTFLLILTVVTIWMFKHRRLRFLHETGLAVIYGLVVGAIIRYTGPITEPRIIPVVPATGIHYNHSVPPDILWLQLSNKRMSSKASATYLNNHTFVYTFRGEIDNTSLNEIDQKATFDPEVFFNLLLPPIIFHAAYSLKRKYFFKNLGAIFTFAFIGTTVTAFVTGSLIWGFIQIFPYLAKDFSFLDTLYFGAVISATDPVTILAIFSELHVDVNLYALVFGESVLNDAIAIVLTRAIQSYAEKYNPNHGGFEMVAFFQAVGEFLLIFTSSLVLGSTLGIATALLTKFTRIRDFPLLETCLFVLMSYTTFLIAEATDLTGIVSVLFCGMCQAHYTYNNLSDDSRVRTKSFFELLNFLAENFIFSYIGVSMFTFPKHHFDVAFICISFIAVALGRAANIYPLSFLLNFGRKPKISRNFQHVLFFSGMRGAMAFALAIRNTMSKARQTFLTTTSLIVIGSVIFVGGSVTPLLTCFGIPVGVDEEADHAALPGTPHRGGDSVEGAIEPSRSGSQSEKSWLARIWGGFDTKYMKPLLTHSKPTLIDTLPPCCLPVARMLTTSEQLNQGSGAHGDSDIELCIDDTDSVRSSGPRAFASTQPGFQRVYFVNDRKMAVDDEERHLFYPIVSPEALSCDSLGNKILPGSSV